MHKKLLAQVTQHGYLSDRSCYLIFPERKSENAALAAFRK